jgi:hypothetical protein
MTVVRTGLFGAVADVHERADVPLLEAIGAEHVEARRLDLLVREAGRDERHAAAIGEPSDVLFQTEHVRPRAGTGGAARPLVRADPLERGDAVVERVREDVHGGVVPVDHLSFDPNLFELVDHGLPSRGTCRSHPPDHGGM